MNSFRQRWLSMKFKLDEWLFIKRLCWVLINIWYWWKDASLTEVFLINGLVAVIHIATKIHSTALGMMVGVRDEPQHPWEDMMHIPPKNDQDIN